MSERLESILQRAEQANGPLAEEIARNLIIEAWAELNPTPSPWRVAKMADGSDWPGDGIGPYTPEAIAWQAKHKTFRTLINAGATIDASMLLIPDGWHIARHYEYPDRDHAYVTLQPLEDPDGERGACANANSNALAFCAAACRAHMAKELVE